MALRFDPEKRSCVVMRMSHDRFQFSEMAGNLLFEATTMSTLEWRHDDKKYGDIRIYSAPYSRPPHTYPTPLSSALAMAHKPRHDPNAGYWPLSHQMTQASLPTSSLG